MLSWVHLFQKSSEVSATCQASSRFLENTLLHIPMKGRDEWNASIDSCPWVEKSNAPGNPVKWCCTILYRSPVIVTLGLELWLLRCITLLSPLAPGWALPDLKTTVVKLVPSPKWPDLGLMFPQRPTSYFLDNFLWSIYKSMKTCLSQSKMQIQDGPTHEESSSRCLRQ